MIRDGKLHLITQALTKASRFVNRDFLELELMQSSTKKHYDFVNKSSKKLSESLSYELEKLQIKLLFSKEDLIDYDNWARSQRHIGHGAIRALLVSPLDGADNFVNALPFFSTTITSLLWNDKNEISADMAAINFPALSELLYTQQGRGVFRERFIDNNVAPSRMRVSGNIDQKDILLGTGIAKARLAKVFSNNLRVFECDSYLLSLFVSGKVDMVVLSGALSSYGYRLFIREAGGFVVDKPETHFKLNGVKTDEVKKTFQNDTSVTIHAVIDNPLIASNR